MSGVIDEPAKHKEDSLRIEHYYDALTEFVTTTLLAQNKEAHALD